MPRLVWFQLKDGRSIVAGCGAVTRDVLRRAVAQADRIFALTADDAVEHIPSAAVRDFTVHDTPIALPASARIFRFLHV